MRKHLCAARDHCWRLLHTAAHHPHRHALLGHGMELAGAALAMAKVEMVANGCLFGGALLLMVLTINGEN